MEKIKTDIFEALDILNPNRLLDISCHELIHDRSGHIIAGKESVRDAGIWNGDYITVIKQR